MQASVYNPDFLRQQVRWIRDDLDPQIARDGPDALHSEEILSLDEFLRRLLASKLSLEDIRWSRLHLAILCICGQATRWPRRLIEKAEALKDAWEARYGPLKKLGTPLYETGGRLHGVCRPEDLSKEKLMVKWLKAPGVKLSPLLARRVGDLGFKPGEYVSHNPSNSTDADDQAAGGSMHCSHSKTASLTLESPWVELLPMQ